MKELKNDHAEAPAGLLWCRKLDATFYPKMMEDGRCPYCLREVR